MRVLTLLLLTLLPWWPGGSRSVEGTHYPDRVEVVNLIDGNLWYQKNLDEAIQEWNRCGSRLHLFVGQDHDAYERGSITIFLDPPGGQEPAYGGWNGTAGIVGLGGGWTRTREVIAHELGHALGFGHAPITADTIMYGSAHVTATDCAGLRNYY